MTSVNEMTAELSKDTGTWFAERPYATLRTTADTWTPLLVAFPSDLPVFEESLKESEVLEIGSVGD